MPWNRLVRRRTLFSPPTVTSDMKREFVLGAVLSAVGVAGYVAGIYVAYPGRALSLTAVMIGITLLAIGRASEEPGVVV